MTYSECKLSGGLISKTLQEVLAHPFCLRRNEVKFIKVQRWAARMSEGMKNFSLFYGYRLNRIIPLEPGKERFGKSRVDL